MRHVKKDIKKNILLFLALIFTQKSALALCTSPSIPVIINGEIASQKEMADTSKKIKKLQENLISYRHCLTQLSTDITGSDDISQQAKVILLERYNESVEREMKVAEKFNKALRAYKSR